MGELLEMSEKEIDRYQVLKQVIDKQIRQKQASRLLGVTERQIRNLLRRLERHGPQGLISRCRGKPSNRKKPDAFKQNVLALLTKQYEGFKPTFAKEKLEEQHNFKVSAETLRLWMIETGLWIPKQKRKKTYLPRKRRECFGELIQADGSHHRWFGENGPMVNLTVFIDDATGTITSLYFSEGETLKSYFEALEQHLKQYGRPRALYTDRYAVFQSQKDEGITNMQRALKTLDVDLILANSPQAKGRVERANRTLQDRLIKEMMLRGIDNIADANRFVPEFLKIYNQKFSKKPMSDFDAHRPLEGHDLERILSRYEERTLLSDCTFQFNRRFYKVQEIIKLRRLKGRKVEIRITRKGKMRVFLKEKELKIIPLDQVIEKPAVLSRKEVLCWKARENRPQPASHPWKGPSYRQRVRKKEIKKYEKAMA